MCTVKGQLRSQLVRLVTIRSVTIFWKNGCPKVDELIKLLQEKQEGGVSVKVVTWKPDMYGFGDSEYWMELHERLRNNGFEMNLVEDYCQHYCIVDRQVVWYGSLNFLGKEDAEDNLMRVISSEIATELMVLTFGENEYYGENL